MHPRDYYSVVVIIVLFFGIFLQPLHGNQVGCSVPDNLKWVKGNGECLRIETFNRKLAVKNPALVIFIHGDTSSGGPADAIFRVAARFEKEDVVSVGLLRPGYYDADGNQSTGNNFNRTDSYTPDNVDAVASAIRNLKSYHNPTTLILVGHSGGAAIAGVILGRHPGLASGAVLAACPFDVYDWSSTAFGRGRGWKRSLSPNDFIKKIPKTARIKVITGERDTNTTSDYAKKYTHSLKKGGIEAEFINPAEANHNNVINTQFFSEAVLELINAGRDKASMQDSSNPNFLGVWEGKQSVIEGDILKDDSSFEINIKEGGIAVGKWGASKRFGPEEQALKWTARDDCLSFTTKRGNIINLYLASDGQKLEGWHSTPKPERSVVVEKRK